MNEGALSAVRQWLQSSESGCFCVKGLNQVEEAKEEASVYIQPYNSFWIATGKKRSLCQFMLDKGLLCGRRSRNSVAMASNNTSVNWTTFKFHAWSWASDTEKAKGTVKSSIPGILLREGSFCGGYWGTALLKLWPYCSFFKEFSSCTFFST